MIDTYRISTERALERRPFPWKNRCNSTTLCGHSGTLCTILESNQASGVRKAHYACCYVRKSFNLLAGTGVREMSSVACGFGPIKIHYFDHQKCFIDRINECSDILLKKHKLHLKHYVMLQSHLLLCWHGFCDASVT